MLDPNGNPVFESADGTQLVDDSGDSIIGPNGQITQDIDGNPVATDEDGTIQTDANGNPIFLDPNGNPLVDSDGNSTRGPDGLPLVNDAGEIVEAVVYTPNGTVLYPETAGGAFVFDGDGNVLLDANGNPVIVPEGGKAPPANATAGAAFGANTTLPDGTPAATLPVRLLDSLPRTVPVCDQAPLLRRPASGAASALLSCDQCRTRPRVGDEAGGHLRRAWMHVCV